MEILLRIYDLINPQRVRDWKENYYDYGISGASYLIWAEFV